MMMIILCISRHLYCQSDDMSEQFIYGAYCCFRCAMALVHSRIGRVFYINHSDDGALGTRYKLHTLTALNHRFDVYHCLLPDSSDCGTPYDVDGDLDISGDQRSIPTPPL